MKFTVIADFQSSGMQFEVGNNHTLEKLARQGVTEDDIWRWYRQGWIQIDGQDPAPPLDPKRTELVINNNKHVVKQKKLGG